MSYQKNRYRNNTQLPDNPWGFEPTNSPNSPDPIKLAIEDQRTWEVELDRWASCVFYIMNSSPSEMIERRPWSYVGLRRTFTVRRIRLKSIDMCSVANNHGPTTTHGCSKHDDSSLLYHLRDILLYFPARTKIIVQWTLRP